MSEPIPTPSKTGAPRLPEPSKKGAGWFKWVLFASVVAALGYVVFLKPRPQTEQGRGAWGNRPVPVAVEIARKDDINVRIHSLGTVTSASTSLIRSRVDGQLKRLFFEEGANVKAGDVLAEIDPRPFEVQKRQAEAQLAKDSAVAENARLDLERFKVLLAQNSVSKQQVDTQEALVRQYEAALKLDQAQVDSAELQLDYAHIKAPVSGRLGLRLVDIGNIVRASDSTGIAVLTQLQPITVLFSIPQDLLPKVARRFKAETSLPVEAFDRDGKTLLATGTLVTIDNQIDPTTGSVKLRAQFPNTDGNLFPNQFVNVQLIAETVEGALVVPNAAVQRGVNGAYVYVVNTAAEPKTVSVRLVDTGPIEAGLSSITKGLTAGENVVVDGIDKLREGATVELVARAGEPGGKSDAIRPAKN